MRRAITLGLVVGLAAAPAVAGARNVVVMVADGAGFNAWTATAMYRGTQGAELQDGEGWLRLAVATHSLRSAPDRRRSVQASLEQEARRVYDPRRAWDARPRKGGPADYPFYFRGYDWLRSNAPDSASSATAISTGIATFDGAINVDGAGRPIEDTLARLAAEAGRSVGVVSDVVLSHATPAAFAGAHNESRRAYCALSVELLTRSEVAVLMGIGHPDYDNNARFIEDPRRRNYQWVGGREVWAHLTGGERVLPGTTLCEVVEEESDTDHAKSDSDEAVQPPVVLDEAAIAALDAWTLVTETASVERIAREGSDVPLLVLPRVGERGYDDGTAPDSYHWIGGALQQTRGSAANPRFTAPGDDPRLAGLPSLATMTSAALAVLDDAPDGFLLFVEGGAVDWAMHSNQLGRMIEELTAFQRAMAAVARWVETESSWDDTLVVVTADHDHLLWGPEAHRMPFDPLVDNGPGRMPLHRWLHHGHSNALVPLFARGAGAEALRESADASDPVRGPYLHHTEIFASIREAMGLREPAPLSGDAVTRSAGSRPNRSGG